MHFPSVVATIILVCLTITCNAQFKILGLLDTKSELNNENVENIRSLVDDVAEPPTVDRDLVVSDSVAIKASDSFDDSGSGSVNFIKPLETSVTNKNEWKSDFVETTSVAAVKSPTTRNVLATDKTNTENVSGDDVSGEPVTGNRGVVNRFKSTTPRSTTSIGTKAYRKTLRPNIRKFSYIEARSFHHPDSPNHVTPRNDYKYMKVVKYRNNYKSKCRCERIWNCPKIQISIQRCEPDYFMCCF